MLNGNRPAWFPNWSGEYAAVIGAGPSLTQADVDKLRGRIRVIAVNTSYRLCAAWGDVLYGCDVNWWKTLRGAPEFKGLKIGFDIDGSLPYADVQRIKIRGWKERKYNWTNDILVDNYGELGAGANSSYQACNLAVQFGVNGIMLLGLDMNDNGKAHWHGSHPSPLVNPNQSNYSKWITHFKEAAPTFVRLGVEVINCTPTSALTGYHKMSIEDTLQRWKL